MKTYTKEIFEKRCIILKVIRDSNMRRNVDSTRSIAPSSRSFVRGLLAGAQMFKAFSTAEIEQIMNLAN